MGELMHRQRSEVKHMMVKYGAVISRIALRKYWRYIGHCWRNTLPGMRDAMIFRDEIYWNEQRQRSKPEVRHRKCGQQVQHWTKNAVLFLQSVSLDLTAAGQRELWEDLEPAFLNFMR
eukprot:4146213-Karenia_brevis.AAC.1